MLLESEAPSFFVSFLMQTEKRRKKRGIDLTYVSASAGAEIGTMKAWDSIEPFRTIPKAEEGC